MCRCGDEHGLIELNSFPAAKNLKRYHPDQTKDVTALLQHRNINRLSKGELPHQGTLVQDITYQIDCKLAWNFYSLWAL